MKISVIVPTYNGEALISETLDSLVNQTLDETEIIVIDDGSTDGTRAVVEKYIEKHKNIIYVYQKNAGVSAARNNGIDRATGKYICFLDSDDLYTPETLENFYKRLEETDSDLAVCNQLNFGYGGEKVNRFAQALSETDIINCYDKRLLWNYLLMNKCFSLKKIKEYNIRFPDMKYSEDAVFCMDYIFKVMPKIVGVKNALFKYRRHTPSEGFSVSQKISYPLLKDFCSAQRHVYESALASFKTERCRCPDQISYINEIIYKAYFSIVTEFYRLLWKADDETLAFLDGELKYIAAMTDDSELEKSKKFHRDIGELICDRKEVAAHPFVSVTVKNCRTGFLETLFEQSMPMFEVIIPEDTKVPENLLCCENIIFLPKKGFKKAAKKTAKGKLKIRLSGKPLNSTSFLKFASLIKKNKLYRILPDSVIKTCAFLFAKIRK